MDFGGNECTHTQTEERDEKAPGADGCQLILWRERERERERIAFHVKTHFHTIMTDGPTDATRTVKLPSNQSRVLLLSYAYCPIFFTPSVWWSQVEACKVIRCLWRASLHVYVSQFP